MSISVDQSGGLRRFREEVEAHLPAVVDRLLSCEPRSSSNAVPEQPGIYLFTENGAPIYVGRTRKLRSRWGQHTRSSSPEHSAPFAFNLAKRKAAADGIDVGRPRKVLAQDQEFSLEFLRAKERVRAMEYRWALVDSPVLSTVVEVYVAMLLGTEGDFNLFETH